MSSNSQFQLLKQQVKALEAEIQRLQENQGSQQDVAAQKQLLQQARTQQASAKQVLMNPASSAEELEAAAPFLPSRGLQEQARLDARTKRSTEQLLKPQFVLQRTDLIDGMKAAATQGAYQEWRNSMKKAGDTTFSDGKKLPNGKARPSANAMKAARILAERTFLKERTLLEPSVKLQPYLKTEEQQSTQPIPLSRFFSE